MTIIQKTTANTAFFLEVWPLVTALDMDDIMFPSENVTGKKPSKYPNGASVTHHPHKDRMNLCCIALR